MKQIQNTGVVGVTSRCSWLWLVMLWSYARELTVWAAAAELLKEKGQQVVSSNYEDDVNMYTNSNT